QDLDESSQVELAHRNSARHLRQASRLQFGEQGVRRPEIWCSKSLRKPSVDRLQQVKCLPDLPTSTPKPGQVRRNPEIHRFGLLLTSRFKRLEEACLRAPEIVWIPIQGRDALEPEQLRLVEAFAAFMREPKPIPDRRHCVVISASRPIGVGK